MTVLLLLKLLLPSLLVGLVSLASRRWGLKIGGVIGGFPIIVGPILFFFVLEQGVDFTTHAALRSLWSVLPFGLFCLTMSWASLRFHLVTSVVLGWAVFLGVSWIGLQGVVSLLPVTLLALSSSILARYGLPKGPHHDAGTVQPSRWDIPMRMAVTISMVLGVTAAAHALGPGWSGSLAAFPIASTTLAAFAYFSDGPYGPAALLRGSLLGVLSYASFCVAVVWCLPRFSVGISFFVAFLAALAAQTATLSLSRPRR